MKGSITAFPQKTISNPKLVPCLEYGPNNEKDLIADMNKIKWFQVAMTELAMELNPSRLEEDISETIRISCRKKLMEDTLDLHSLGIDEHRYDLSGDILEALNVVTLCNFTEEERSHPLYKSMVDKFRQVTLFH